MFKAIQTILFATDLSENCRNAFEMAASIATRYQATLVLLHVMEDMPDAVTSRVKDLFGEKKWSEMVQDNINEARHTLIGKKTSARLIEVALKQFCIDAGIDDTDCGYHSREIVVVGGDIVKNIISHSKSYKADLVIIGSSEGLLSDNRIGQTIKTVMRSSESPVMVVPSKSR